MKNKVCGFSFCSCRIVEKIVCKRGRGRLISLLVDKQTPENLCFCLLGKLLIFHAAFSAREEWFPSAFLLTKSFASVRRNNGK